MEADAAPDHDLLRTVLAFPHPFAHQLLRQPWAADELRREAVRAAIPASVASPRLARLLAAAGSGDAEMVRRRTARDSVHSNDWCHRRTPDCVDAAHLYGR